MIATLLVGAGALVLVFALLSPLESLRWWSKRRDDPVVSELTRPVLDHDPALAVQPRAFVVYLSGIGSMDGSTDSRREQKLLASLAEALPDVVVTADVFPYAVENRALTQRASAWFWTRVRAMRRVPVASATRYLVNLRNVLRVLVSADPRYGPTFNLAVAQEITESLTEHGYDWEERRPVAIVGYSGGGQIALGSAWFLAALGIPTSVVSLGGVLSDDPALDRVEHVWHLYGSRDRTQRLGAIVFPGRWPTAPLSAWNRAVRAGRITRREIGPMKHTGKRDYFDRHATDDDGLDHRQLTLDALVEVLGEIGARR